MKHTFTKLLTPALLSLATASLAQDNLVIDDFENGLKKWSAIESVSFQIVDNPSPDAVNSSDKVLKCTRKAGSKSWAGTILRGALSANITSDDSGYTYATVKFKKESRGNVSFKLESGPNDETFESTVSYPVTDDWTTVTFDLKSAYSGTYSDFFVMIDREESISSSIVVYIDDITLHKTKKLEETQVDPKAQKGTGEKDGYHLVWQDLFDNNALDNEAWNVEVRNDGGGNNELQYYLKENVTVGNDGEGNGCLTITAKKQSYGNKQATSGRLTTQNKVRFCHGKIEASIKFPKTANGLWPAFWLLGDDIQSNNWPNCGEIDILEMGHSDAFSKGTQDRYFNGACHWGPKTGDGGHPNYTQSNTWNYSLQDGEFHLFTMYWDDQKLSMYVDQDRFPEVSPYFEMSIADKSQQNSAGNYFHHNFFVLFNLAVGGDFSHIYNVNEVTALNQGDAKMYVNYVKIYQKGISGETYNGPTLKETAVEREIANSTDKFGKSGKIFNALGIHIANYTDGNVNDLQLPEGIYIVAPNNGKAWKLRIRR